MVQAEPYVAGRETIAAWCTENFNCNFYLKKKVGGGSEAVNKVTNVLESRIMDFERHDRAAAARVHSLVAW